MTYSIDGLCRPRHFGLPLENIIIIDKVDRRVLHGSRLNLSEFLLRYAVSIQS